MPINRLPPHSEQEHVGNKYIGCIKTLKLAVIDFHPDLPFRLEPDYVNLHDMNQIKKVFRKLYHIQGADYLVNGTFMTPSHPMNKNGQCTFVINPNGKDSLYVTGVPVNNPLPLFHRVVWYDTIEDDHRVYLFQIVRQV